MDVVLTDRGPLDTLVKCAVLRIGGDGVRTARHAVLRRERLRRAAGRALSAYDRAKLVTGGQHV